MSAKGWNFSGPTFVPWAKRLPFGGTVEEAEDGKIVVRHALTSEALFAATTWDEAFAWTSGELDGSCDPLLDMSLEAMTPTTSEEPESSPDEAPWHDAPPAPCGWPGAVATGAESTDAANWHRARRSGIGASEIAMVLGISPWGDAGTVYAAKVNPGAPKGAEWLEWGHRLERVILEAFTSPRYAGGSVVRTDDGAIDGRLLRSRDHAWALATIDAFVFSTDGDPCVLEIKTARDDSDWSSGVPEHYRAQVQQQLLVTGAPRGFIACLVAGSRLIWDVVERDEAMIRRIVRAGSELWQRVIDRDPPPSLDHDAIGRMYAFERGRRVELGEPDLHLALERDDLKSLERRAKDRLRVVEARIKQAIGGAHEALLPDGSRLTYAPRRDGVRVLRRAGVTE